MTSTGTDRSASGSGELRILMYILLPIVSTYYSFQRGALFHMTLKSFAIITHTWRRTMGTAAVRALHSTYVDVGTQKTTLACIRLAPIPHKY